MDTNPAATYQSKRGAHVPANVKAFVLERVTTGGKSVADVAAEYKITKKAIYRWLEETNDSSHGEVAKLRKENTALKLLVAELSLGMHTAQKKTW